MSKFNELLGLLQRQLHDGGDDEYLPQGVPQGVPRDALTEEVIHRKNLGELRLFTRRRLRTTSWKSWEVYDDGWDELHYCEHCAWGRSRETDDDTCDIYSESDLWNFHDRDCIVAQTMLLCGMWNSPFPTPDDRRREAKKNADTAKEALRNVEKPEGVWLGSYEFPGEVRISLSHLEGTITVPRSIGYLTNVPTAPSMLRVSGSDVGVVKVVKIVHHRSTTVLFVQPAKLPKEA